MKKNLIRIIAIVTALSLIGIVLTQFLWVNRAVKLRTEQFNYMVYMGLKEVVDQISDYEFLNDSLITEDTVGDKNAVRAEGYISEAYKVGLDTLMRNEFGCLRGSNEFLFGVYDTINNTFLYGNFAQHEIPVLYESGHRISASKLNEGRGLELVVFFPDEKQLITRRMFVWLLILSGLFLLIVINSFLYIIFSILKQKKLSEIKNDFINNMTHEFKTPISTISVAAEILMRPTICEQTEKIRKYANIIYDENLRLRNQVEQVLQISVLDKNELKLNKTEIDVNKIIENSIDIFGLIIKDKNGTITSDLTAKPSCIIADELHFINVITNMIDNAIKYSSQAPEIKISTRNNDQGVIIQIRDNGIGISSVNQKHIYKKFFRVHTGNVHDVKGFGLGLFYVKTVVDAHGGTVSLVQSDQLKGSVFELFFPFNNKKDEHE